MKFPKTLGQCIDKLYTLRQERKEIERKAEAVKEKESALERHIIESFSKTDLDGARGTVAVAGLSQATVPTVKDWDALYKYVKKHNAFDLLQKRVSATAYRERLDVKEVVPGVEPFITTKLSLTKR
jgi:hypothetical protein